MMITLFKSEIIQQNFDTVWSINSAKMIVLSLTFGGKCKTIGNPTTPRTPAFQMF